MTRRMKLILTRPADDSLEAFVTFRKNTSLKLKDSRKVLLKDDLVNEWEKFWTIMNKTSIRKLYMCLYIS